MLVFVCLFASGGSAQDQGVEVPAPPEKPNIVLILTDDQAFSDLFSGAMPRTNALLVQKGATYRSAYVTLSVCCPSRATILRGQYAHNHRVIDNHKPTGGVTRFRELGLENSTVATWLQGAGYETSMIGKYMNGYMGEHVAPGWDDWHVLSRFFPTTRTINNNGVEETFPGTIEEHLGDRAVEFVEGAEGPFYLHLGTHAPHDPYDYKPGYGELYRNANPPRYASFNEKDVSDKPPWIRNRQRFNDSNVRWIENAYRERLRSLRMVDDLVGDVVEAVRAKGELENTYFFFISDNGWHYGEHRIVAGKWTPYEESHRVPFVVRGPGVPENVSRSPFVLNNDLAPTFAEIAGAETPDFVDGRSIVPTFASNTPAGWRTAFAIEGYRTGSAGVMAPTPTYAGVRTRHHKYVVYPGTSTREKELYDLSRDPRELHNSWRGAGAPLKRAMTQRLEALRNCSGEGCRRAEGFR